MLRPLMFAVLSLAGFATSTASAQTTRTVCASGCDFTSINAAIDASSDGDVINIAAGTYNEHALNPHGKAITIQGTLNEDGSLATTIDAQQAGGVFYIESYEDASTVIQHLIIIGGAGDNGSGITCEYSSPSIIACTIMGNSTNYQGGGIFCLNSNATIRDCTISGNKGYRFGGAIYSGDEFSPSHITLIGCTITSNNSIVGGGLYLDLYSPATISNCNITGNTADLWGGGIYCEATGSDPTISGGTVCGNTPNQIAGPYTTGQPEPVIAPTCPPATGACCLGGTCITATESDCNAAGGTYGSDDMACADANCASTIPGDVDGDGDVDTNDLSSLRSTLALCASDTDMDGDTDIEDLLNVVAGWGTTCP